LDPENIERTNMEMVKLTVLIPKEDAEILKEMALKEGQTVTYKLRQCIVDEKFFRKITDEGGKIVIEKDGKYQEIYLK